jgi:DNA polymerase III delta prime subunit
MENVPWIEKYRPTDFNNIVLDTTNKKILLNIVKKRYFPNLLFYGPPGTGKTTTIINLIDMYHKKYNLKKKGCMIHLNASDDRGIDIIRNQINQFVNTKTLFGEGMKFVILDEVDYMTKNAQQALRYLIQQYSDNIRFCLICNYISRIEYALQNEFVRLRFSQLPKNRVFKFLNSIQKEENLNISNQTIFAIQSMFKSDIRSMINFLQSNHTEKRKILKSTIITNKVWEKLIEKIKKNKPQIIINLILNQCNKYNTEIKEFINKFIQYLIFKDNNTINNDFINNFKYIVHNSSVNDEYFLNYFVYSIVEQYSLL